MVKYPKAHSETEIQSYLGSVFVSISVDVLQERLYDKNGLTLKDLAILLVSLRICRRLEAVAEPVIRNWDPIVKLAEELLGTTFENVPLTRLWAKNKGRPPIYNADLVAKFSFCAPYTYIKEAELEKAKSEYLRDVRIHDKRNPYYRHAIRKASTTACMRVKRAFDAFRRGLQNDLLAEVVMLMMEEMEKELAKPRGERCTIGGVAERAGRRLARQVLGRKTEDKEDASGEKKLRQWLQRVFY